jgi:hypothetical protein
MLTVSGNTSENYYTRSINAREVLFFAAKIQAKL